MTGTAKPRALVLTLGGTIASVASVAGTSPSLRAEDLLSAVPALNDLGSIDARPIRQVPSSDLTPVDVLDLAREIAANAREYQGFVVTQGTDTLEETAFFLDLVLDIAPGVVVTGAMRPAMAIGTDGPRNLESSVRVALETSVHETGVLVVLNDEIHAAPFVAKGDTSLPSAFESHGAGRLGFLAEGRVTMLMRPLGRTTVPLVEVDRARLEALHVPILALGLGTDGTAERPMVDQPLDGLVVEALGGGHVPSPMVALLGDAAGRCPVVVATRVPGGQVLKSTYRFAGSERDLLGRGLMTAGTLSPSKARVLLLVLLASGASPGTVDAVFRAFGGGSEKTTSP